MVELRLLGPVSLRNEDGSFNNSFLTGPKRLALFCYLLLAKPRGFHRRDSLIALFWPDKGQKSARNSLSNMLYQIRDSLGNSIILNRGSEELRINRDLIWCDAIAFEEYLKQDKLSSAIGIYGGDLLSGFHVKNISNDFIDWLDFERERLRKLAFQISWKLAENAENAGEYNNAMIWGKAAVDYTNYSEDAYIKYLGMLNRIGKYTEALKVYKNFEYSLKEKWELEPSDEIQKLIHKIKEKKENFSLKFTPKQAGQFRERSIAVIPFENIGENKDSVFTKGIHGELVTQLSGLSKLQVISRTSVRKYAHTVASVTEIGRELNVEYVLEGEIQETEDEVGMNVRLINARNDRQIWAGNFRRKITAHNLFQIQRKITQKIASALQAELTPEEKRQIGKKPTSEIEAYRLYMQGWSWIEQRTEKCMYRGLKYFEDAQKADPGFTLAMVGQALALLGLHGYGYDTSDKILFQAEKLIENVLQNDQNLAEAYAALGLLETSRYNGIEAVSALKKAVELRPGYANAHNKLSWLYQLIGKPEEALKSAKKAVELDPFSPEAVINLSFSYLINGNKKNALHYIEKTCDLQPSWNTAVFYKGLILFHMHDYNTAQKLLNGISVEWAEGAPRCVFALIDLLKNDLKSFDKHLDFFKKRNQPFNEAVLLSAAGEIKKASQIFKNLEMWPPWPTHAIYYHFPDQLNKIRVSREFDDILTEVKRWWNVT